MKKTTILFLTLLAFSIAQNQALAESQLLGLNTSGVVYQISPKSGTLTEKATQEFTSFGLGAFTRVGKKLYYIAAPAGSTENALFTYNLKNNSIKHLDLDRSDDARLLFSRNGKLYGLFYNVLAGVNGIYSINTRKGKTKRIINLSRLEVEPIAGAIAEIGEDFYLLAKPNTDSNTRRLLRLNLETKSLKAFSVLSKGKQPALCDRLQYNKATQDFVCLASPTSDQVEFCRLSLLGKAKCNSALNGIVRIAGGLSFISPDDKNFYALVYATGESNNQRLLKLNAKGKIRNNATINTLLIGAKF